MAEQRTLSSQEQACEDLANKLVTEQPSIVAVLTLVVDANGTIKPMLLSRMSEAASHTIRVAMTQLLSEIVGSILKRPFRCGCSTCEANKDKQVRGTISNLPWTTTKAEA